MKDSEQDFYRIVQLEHAKAESIWFLEKGTIVKYWKGHIEYCIKSVANSIHAVY